MRHLILAISFLTAGCSVATPLFQTLVWNPNYCTSCYLANQPQPSQFAPLYTYPTLQQELDAQQFAAAIRQDQIRQDNQLWRQRWAGQSPTE